MRETRITAIFAFVAAVAAATVGVSHFLMPRAQLHFATGVTPAFFESLAAGSGAFRIHYGAFVVAALASTAVVLGVRRLVAAPRHSAGRLGERWDRCFPGSDARGAPLLGGARGNAGPPTHPRRYRGGPRRYHRRAPLVGVDGHNTLADAGIAPPPNC